MYNFVPEFLFLIFPQQAKTEIFGSHDVPISLHNFVKFLCVLGHSAVWQLAFRSPMNLLIVVRSKENRRRREGGRPSQGDSAKCSMCLHSSSDLLSHTLWLGKRAIT
jgi:hypothetical protein